MKLENASQEHVDSICDLVNLSYRGENGWTRETGFVSGDRIRPGEVQDYLSNPKAHFLVGIDNDELISCVCIEENEDSAYIGLLAVHPGLQGTGIGKEILAQAESYASATFGAEKYVMVVVSQRKELVEYYERRGYIRTGNIQEYPVHLNVGVPLESGLTIEYLEKSRARISGGGE
ncbi:MAG: GNAT family N-acetyltransferase [Gammaproteobacteria bacterium]|nr:GNAT family N-acetyltransferase [Gammaproteobacteria bacterium]